jgi:uncharacterized protein (TIGR03437 family)
VNILTPPDAIKGPVQVQLTNNGATSAAYMAQAQPTSPSFFVINGGPHVLAQHADFKLLGPSSLNLARFTPAKPGEVVVLYANGFGPTTSPVVSGSLMQSGSLAPLPAVKIGGIAATVLGAVLVAPGQFQFNVMVPLSALDGNNTIAATYNGISTQGNAVVAVQH